MKRNCPKKTCKSDQIIKNGFFFRANDSRKVQRFKCKTCGTKFSSSTGTLEFGQKKRRVNPLLLKLFCAKVTQKRAARIAGVNKVTVARKFDYWAKKAALNNHHFREKLAQNKCTHIQFDDLITKEKTKLKPLSVTVVVDAKRRFILDVNVSQIAAFGHLAQISKKKYGTRKSEHKEALDEVFKNIKPLICPHATIQSDEHQNYAPVVKRYFPNADYRQYKSERACVAGQGELKKTKFDPIFAINHTLAIMRDSIGTLVRRTWCTTQDPKRLRGHLEIFIYYYNQFYLGGLDPG
jgi:transposase-like protein